MPVTVKIQHRRDTAANWTAADPILSSGEIGIETDSDRLKIGDGATAWSALSYYSTVGTTERLYKAINQVAHGFAVGDPIRHDGTSWLAATANTLTDSRVFGVVSMVTDADNFTVALGGIVDTLSGLTPGSYYYLQDAGGIGTGVGTVEAPVLFALTATSALLVFDAASALGELQAHEVAADPHPQYEAVGTAAAAITTHEAAADPHPGYLTTAEGDAAYEASGAAAAAVAAHDASIGNHDDVDITTTPPTDGQALVWDAASSLFIPGSVAAGEGGAASGFHATLSADQAIAPGAAQVVLFDSEIIDEDGAYNPATGIWTCPDSGWYLISASALFHATLPAGTRLSVNLFVNSSYVHALGQVVMNSDAENMSTPGSHPMNLTAGDTVEIRARHEDVASHDIFGNQETYFIIVRLGGGSVASGDGAVAALPVTIVRPSAVQTAVDNTELVIAHATIDRDDQGMFDALNPTRLTAQTAGAYLVSSEMAYGSSATIAGRRHLRIKKNGAVVYQDVRNAVTDAGSWTIVSGQHIVELAAGDYIELAAFHTDGNDIDIQPSSTSLRAVLLEGPSVVGQQRGIMVAKLSATTATIAQDTTVLVPFDTATYDPDGWFDPVTSRYTPQKAGFYQVNASVAWSLVDSQYRMLVNLRKNGGNVAAGYATAPTVKTLASVAVSAVVYMNGSTDYLEVYSAHADPTARAIWETATSGDATLFTAHYIGHDGGGSSGRTRLTADTTLYVDGTLGSDANDGTSSGAGAFATIQKAIDVASSDYDLAAYTLTISVATGAYTESITLKSLVGGVACRVVGDTVTPSNVIVSPATGDCFGIDGAVVGTYDLRGLKVTTPDGYGIAANQGPATIKFRNLDFGSCGKSHLISGAVGYIQSEGDYAITGGASSHFECYDGGFIRFAPEGGAASAVTLTGTPAFTQFANASRGGNVLAVNVTYSGGATGVRYIVNTRGGITVIGGAGSGSTNYFPGDAAGNADAATFGLYG